MRSSPIGAPTGLTVYMSTQFTAGVRDELARGIRSAAQPRAGRGRCAWAAASARSRRSAITAAPPSRCRARPARRCASCSIGARNRWMPATGPATWQRLRIGARRDGTLTAISLDSYGTAGVGGGRRRRQFRAGALRLPEFRDPRSTTSSSMPGQAARCAARAIRRARSRSSRRSTNWPKSSASIRWRCATGSTRARCGARSGGSARERIGWSRRHAPGADPGPVKRGLGMAQSLWGANVQTNASCEVRLMRDGSVEVLSSVQDIGTGIGTVLAQVVAEVLGLRPEEITVRIGDTEFPAGPPSYGSRTTASITPPARTAAWRVLQALFARRRRC